MLNKWNVESGRSCGHEKSTVLRQAKSSFIQRPLILSSQSKFRTRLRRLRRPSQRQRTLVLRFGSGFTDKDASGHPKADGIERGEPPHPPSQGTAWTHLSFQYCDCALLKKGAFAWMKGGGMEEQ
ncbi:unnamed protein product [Symbiodinium natans]|uniref:Uncharacterized protein n=1 Tax=Symbiodinium natans TaxID=878477 RepID=A0A812USP8_9DINO|nr:unnamed protein product [Symbiodinium natans]